eukprot:6484906-Amphidinium_carterae.1
MATAYVPGGRISFYMSNNLFEASCNNPHHGRCVLSRGKDGRKGKAGKRFGGRPLGMMMKWLADGASHDMKASHWDKSNWNWSQEQRLEARRALAQISGGQQLLDQERELVAGESEEPPTFLGMV